MNLACRTSRLAHKFSRTFGSSPGSSSLTLPELLSQFSLPVSLGDIKDMISNEVSPVIRTILTRPDTPTQLADVIHHIFLFFFFFSLQKIVEMAVWLLQHKQIIQLHTYVYIVPTTISLDDSLVGGGHTPVTTSSVLLDSGSVKSQEECPSRSKKEKLLAHLTDEERSSILSTAAAADDDDLEEFGR